MSSVYYLTSYHNAKLLYHMKFYNWRSFQRWILLYWRSV